MTKARALALLMIATFLETSFRKGWTRTNQTFQTITPAQFLCVRAHLCATTMIGRGSSAR
jgi:hypothetical protein